jgi:predicted sulfurtransferase
MKTTEKPTIQGFHIDGVRHVTPNDALDAIEKGEAVMIDVREFKEVALESIPLDHVLNHPMSMIMDRLPYISKNQNIIIICQGGVRSVKITDIIHINTTDFGIVKGKTPFGTEKANEIVVHIKRITN